MLQSLFGRVKERFLPGAEKEEECIRFAVLRYQDGDQVLHLADDPFVKFYAEGNPQNVAYVDVPKEAIVKTKEGGAEFKGGKVSATSFGVYPMEAKWVPDETTEGDDK